MPRGFQVVKGFEDKEINLPKRNTKNAAGYDFEAVEDMTIPPLCAQLFKAMVGFMHEEKQIHLQKLFRPTLIPTGLKVYMLNDEGLFLHNRSSNPLKRFLGLSNGVGVIDADYYENPDNDGHIMFQFLNFGLLPIHIKKGEKIGQGVFQKFLLIDDDTAEGQRTGGHGSTGQ